MISKLTMVLDSLMISNNKMLILDWDKKNTSVGGTDIVIDHLLACYSEFCSNNMFGIASYLGRRIRHGTFKGTKCLNYRKKKNMLIYSKKKISN